MQFMFMSCIQNQYRVFGYTMLFLYCTTFKSTAFNHSLYDTSFSIQHYVWHMWWEKKTNLCPSAEALRPKIKICFLHNCFHFINKSIYTFFCSSPILRNSFSYLSLFMFDVHFSIEKCAIYSQLFPRKVSYLLLTWKVWKLV